MLMHRPVLSLVPTSATKKRKPKRKPKMDNALLEKLRGNPLTHDPVLQAAVTQLENIVVMSAMELEERLRVPNVAGNEHLAALAWRKAREMAACRHTVYAALEALSLSMLEADRLALIISNAATSD